ncbi:MAG: hypothetical protein HOJ35_06275, partial [Bdellovibrionales bacterium]|nr:hypothetical protein [Bdellovibrionales bacterium]
MNNNKTKYTYVLFIFLILMLFVNGKYTQELKVEEKVSHIPGIDFNTSHEKEFNPNDDQIGINRPNYPLISTKTAKKLVDHLWKKYPIVDGLLEPHKYDVNFETE